MVATPEQVAAGRFCSDMIRAQLDELRSFFAFAHLPPRLRSVSAPFADLALRLEEQTTLASFELVEALRQLLLAKDAAVRAVVLSDRVCGPPGTPGAAGSA